MWTLPPFWPFFNENSRPPLNPSEIQRDPPKLVEFHIHSPQNRWKWSTPQTPWTVLTSSLKAILMKLTKFDKAVLARKMCFYSTGTCGHKDTSLFVTSEPTVGKSGGWYFNLSLFYLKLYVHIIAHMANNGISDIEFQIVFSTAKSPYIVFGNWIYICETSIKFTMKQFR